MAENPFDLAEAPLTEPVSLVAGFWVGWRRDLDYDDSMFSLVYRFGDLTITGDLIDGYWQFEVPGATSADLEAADYRWDLVVIRISDDEEFVHSTGVIRVFTTSGERRTHAEIMVSKIESILVGRADSDVSNYSIKNRSITKMSVKELTEWRDYYLTEVGRTGGSTTGGQAVKKNTVRVRFI